MSVQKSAARKKREAARRRVEERRWASRSGPVTVREAPRCDQCQSRPVEHIVLMPPAAGREGGELRSCSSCWPALQILMSRMGGTVLGCGCGEC